MSTTEHKKYYFKASEFNDGTPYINTESVGGDLAILKNCSLYFALPDHTSFAEAKGIAEYLNEKIIFVCTTTLDQEE